MRCYVYLRIYSYVLQTQHLLQKNFKTISITNTYLIYVNEYSQINALSLEVYQLLNCSTHTVHFSEKKAGS